MGGGKGSATLSMGYAGARLGRSVLAGLAGRRRVECAYVKSSITDLPYFASKVVFGEGGVTKVLPLGELNEHETKRLAEVKEVLKGEIESGTKYAEAAALRHDSAPLASGRVSSHNLTSLIRGCKGLHISS